MNNRIKYIIAAVVSGGVLTLMAAFGVLKKPDLSVSDAFYQGRTALNGKIVLIGIDQKSMDEIGPYSEWGRDVIATAIDILNESEGCRPAVIALDILYSGKTDRELDGMLAGIAGRYGNVITAGAAQFGNDLVADGMGDYGLDTFSVQYFEKPYEELYSQTTLGHINVMLDGDGIFRHHMLNITLKDGTVVPSIALAAANMYREYKGEGKVELPNVNSRGFWYLPFGGEPGDFESIPLIDILTGEVTADYFNGKIVFIGPYVVGFQDSYFTSIDHAEQMYGMEIHANATWALLWGNHKKEVGKAIQTVILFIVLLLAFWAFFRRRVVVSTAVWAGICGGWVLFCRLMYNAGFIYHILWVPVGVTILYVGCIAANYIKAAIEKQRVTNTFKRYVDPSVIHELLKEGSDALGLGGRMTDIAVLFVDIRGFTTMSELLTPPQVVAILNQYLTLTTKCVMDNHGTLDKFVGDCTMAMWNAPLPQEDYVMNACKAAMAMVDGSKPLAEKLQKEFGRTVSFGVGVNVGPAVVGNIGAPMRMDYTAIGDTVNTAARLEANAPAGTVYISRAVADVLGDRIRTTSLGDSIKLKGKKEGFEILVLEEIYG